jgi:hypothetical protein
VGLALEPETLAQQLERFRLGGAPPPVKMVVADSGNGLLRRVRADGVVETLETTSASTFSAFQLQADGKPTTAAALALSSPWGITADLVGNFYFTEQTTGHVKVRLHTGEVVTAVQGGTFRSPRTRRSSSSIS